MMKCKRCKKAEVPLFNRVIFNRLDLRQLCSKCRDKVREEERKETEANYWEEQNKKTAAKLKDFVETKLIDLNHDFDYRHFHYNSRQALNNFYSSLNDAVQSVYDNLHGCVLLSLQLSIEHSLDNLQKGLPKSKYEKCVILLKELSDREKNNTHTTNEQYEEFKTKARKAGLTIVEKLEAGLNLQQLIKTVDDFANKVSTERITEKIEEMRKRDHERLLREEAEKKLYGQVKKIREPFTETERESIFAKFNYQCITCGKNEGLHIHHRNKNPKDNRIENLLVLCSLCHKKIHMRVR